MVLLFKKLFNNQKVKRLVYKTCQIYHRNTFMSTSYALNTEYPNTNAKNPICILGIDTSSDVTGAAVVSEGGQILGEGRYPQVESVRWGGIKGTKMHHEKNIDKAISEALNKSNINPADLSAVAATVKPGLKNSIRIGYNYGKMFALKYKLPFIPIDHMEAHALTVRMENQVEFPFLALLLSGGHSILCIAHSLNQWSIISENKNPGLSLGILFDQIAWQLNIRSLPGLSNVIGGEAIEILAKKGNPKHGEFGFEEDRKYPDFSFIYIKQFFGKLITYKFHKDVAEGGVLENVNDICASVQYSSFKYLVRKTQYGFKFVQATKKIPPENKTLVISGGMASNQFLRDYFQYLCDEEGYRLLIPPPNLCTDNGVMVAWNGIEKWKMGVDVLRTEEEINSVIAQKVFRTDFGLHLRKEFEATNLPVIKTLDMKFDTKKKKKN